MTIHITDALPASFVNMDDADDCGILVVDDNATVLAITKGIITRLGYVCRSAANAFEALAILTADPSIGIILLDIDMPEFDGFDLNVEIQERFALNRELITILHSQYLDYETAVLAIRAGVFDVLEKPASARSLAKLLRRAQIRRHQQIAAMAKSAAQEGIMTTDVAMKELPHMTADRAASDDDEASSPHPGDNAHLLISVLKEIIARRQERRKILPDDLISDPAWDMILDLTLSKLKGETLSVSGICTATNAPLTTAIRWLKNMQTHQLVKRWTDPLDKRRDLVELSDETYAQMIQYLMKNYIKYAG